MGSVKLRLPVRIEFAEAKADECASKKGKGYPSCVFNAEFNEVHGGRWLRVGAPRCKELLRINYTTNRGYGKWIENTVKCEFDIAETLC